MLPQLQALSEPRDSLISKFDISYESMDTRRIPLIVFLDEGYDAEKFFKGKYSFGAVADLDEMMRVYNYFSRNWNKQKTNTTIDEYVMHHIHQTNSQIYDYDGKEEYKASYFMADIDFGTKFNVILGARKEENETVYNSKSSLDHALPHWIFVGEDETHKRNNAYFLPALFLNYKPTSSLSIRYAQTNTLTRPDYTSIIPLSRANGSGRTLDWRNKFLKPGLSRNIDLSVSFNEDRLGLITVGYFKRILKI